MGLITHEVQKYHIVDRLFTPTESRLILNEIGFYHRSPTDPIQAAFQRLEDQTAPNRPSVIVRELIDDLDSVPVAEITPEALTTLHDLRNQRFTRRFQGTVLK